MKIKIDKRNFNPLYFELKKFLNDKNIRTIIVYGGTSAAKTFSICQHLVIDLFQNKYSTAVFRKESTTIDSTVYKDCKTISSKFKMRNKLKHIKHCIRKNEDCEIKFFGLDDPEKAKGLSSYKKIYANEISKFDKEDYDELLDRMRGIEGQQLIVDFNPIDENHWMKKEIDEEQWIDLNHSLPGENSFVQINTDGDMILIRTTYQDNYWVVGSPYPGYGMIDVHALKRFETLKKRNPSRYRVNALGEWGVEDNPDPWLYSFDYDVHTVDRIPLMPSYPVYLSFDFNKDPFTCNVIQMSPHQGHSDSFIHFIDQYKGKMTITEMCTRIKTKYKGCILYVTGDRSGSLEGEIASDSLYESAYKIIKGALGISDKQLHINKSNMTHASSRVLCNAMFEQYPNLRLSRSACPDIINDCRIAKKDPKSKDPHKLLKDRGIYKMDLFDGLRYFFQTYFSKFAETNYFK
jgi:phage terminase large subunit